jgi:hypothetical protein
MKKIKLILFFALFFNYTNAQRPKTGEWYSFNLPLNFSKHMQWHHDGSYRTLGTSFRPFQYLYRTGIRYNFNNQMNAAGGVAFFFTKTDFDKSDHEFGKEFRFWEEINRQQTLSEKLQLLLRVRVEQRFFAATSRKEKYTGHRFRIRTGLNRQLIEKWSLELADEYMRQVVQGNFSFDQNRVIFSVIHQFNKSSQIQTNYMWFKWPDENQHILSITYTKTISLYGGGKNNK